METSLASLILDRCAQAIEQLVVPDLSKEFAYNQAMSVAKVLRKLASALQVPNQLLREENEVMEAVINRAVLLLREAHIEDAAATSLVEKLENTVVAPDCDHGDVREANYRLREALVAVIEGVDALGDLLPVEAISALKRSVRSAIRQQLDNGIEHVAFVTLTKEPLFSPRESRLPMG